MAESAKGTSGVTVPVREVRESGWEAALVDGERWVLELVAREVPFDVVLTALARLIEAIAGEGLLASIMLLDEAGTAIRVGAAPGLPSDFCREIDGGRIGPAAGSCGTAAYRREAVIVTDIATDPLWDDYRHLALPHGLAACWSTPIWSSDGGQVLGTFACYYREPRAPDAAHLRLATMVSRTAALVIERARATAARAETESERERLLAAEREARAAAERAHRLLTAQHRIGLVLEESTLEEAPSRLIQAMCDVLDWTCGAFWEVRDAVPELRCVSVWHAHDRHLEEFERATVGRTFVSGEGLPGRAWEAGRPVWIPDLSRDAGFVRTVPAARAGLRAALAFPVLSGGRVVAVVECFGAAVRPADEEILATAAALGPQIGQYIERRRADEALRESEARFRELFETAPVGYQELDSEGRFVRVNRALCELLGYEAEELLGLHVWDLQWAHGEPREETRRKLLDRLARGEPWHGVERVRVRKDGSLRTVWVEDTLVRDASGAVTGLRSTQVDITERKAAELERDRLYAAEREARAEAEAALAARDRFIASVSHDLQNPLAAIKGYAQLARRQVARGAPDSAERGLAAVGTIEVTAQRMSMMIGELLDATRLDAGAPLELRRQPVDLVQLMGEAVRFHEAVAAGHAIRVDVAASDIRGEWDTERLERVVANLLGNAIKYSPDGGEILVTIGRDADFAVLSVRDHGLGIPESDLPHVFERYRRGANVADKISGTGLGLAGARDIVELHGGSIAVESVEGRGSTFTVRLPVAPP